MTTVPLRRVVEVIAGQSPSSEDVHDYLDGLPFIQGNAEFSDQYPVPHLQCNVASKRATAGDLLLSVRAPVGALNWADGPLGIGRGVAALRPSTDWDSRFIAYGIRSRLPDLRSMATGSTFEAVTSDTLGALELPAADPHEQQRIADFLDDRVSQIDRIIAARREQMAALRAWHDASIREITETAEHPSRPTGVHWHPTVAEDWGFPRVAQAFKTGSGSTPPSDNVEYYGGAIPWVTTGDIRDAGLATTGKTVTELAIADFSTLAMYPPGTLLVAMYGQGKTKGRVALLETRASVNQACCAIQGSPSMTEWAFFWFRAHKSAIVELANGSGQPNLSQDIIRSIRLALPSEAERHRLLNRLRELDREVAGGLQASEAQIRLWMECKSSLITAAVAGELDVSTAGSSIPG